MDVPLFSPFRPCWAAAALILAALTSGCVGFASHLGYWSGGSMVPPEYAGLAGQRVAVVCVSDSSSYGSGRETEYIARRVAALLDENVKDISTVSASKVADWVDKNGWDRIDYREVGRGVKADRVVAIDLQGFQLHEGQTLYKGRASMMVTVFDMQKDGEQVFRRSLEEITYPANGVVHATDTSEAKFQRSFLQILARKAARHFFQYDFLEEGARDPAFVRT